MVQPKTEFRSEMTSDAIKPRIVIVGGTSPSRTNYLFNESWPEEIPKIVAKQTPKISKEARLV